MRETSSRVGEHDLSPERSEEDAAFQGHAGWHCQDELISSGSRDESKPNTCISAARPVLFD